MNIPEMVLIRNRIKQAVMDLFLSEFRNALEVNARVRPIKDSNYPELNIYDIYDKNSRAIYVVAPRPEYDRDSIFKKIVWKCNCLYSLKCGMPCSHEIKVLMLKNGSILDQIH